MITRHCFLYLQGLWCKALPFLRGGGVCFCGVFSSWIIKYWKSHPNEDPPPSLGCVGVLVFLQAPPWPLLCHRCQSHRCRFTGCSQCPTCEHAAKVICKRADGGWLVSGPWCWMIIKEQVAICNDFKSPSLHEICTNYSVPCIISFLGFPTRARYLEKISQRCFIVSLLPFFSL